MFSSTRSGPLNLSSLHLSGSLCEGVGGLQRRQDGSLLASCEAINDNMTSNDRVVADVWAKDAWDFQLKSGSSGSCRLFLHFLGKIAVQRMSGKTPGSPRHPSSRHPRPFEVTDSRRQGTRSRNTLENVEVLCRGNKLQ